MERQVCGGGWGGREGGGAAAACAAHVRDAVSARARSGALKVGHVSNRLTVAMATLILNQRGGVEVTTGDVRHGGWRANVMASIPEISTCCRWFDSGETISSVPLTCHACAWNVGGNRSPGKKNTVETSSLKPECVVCSSMGFTLWNSFNSTCAHFESELVSNAFKTCSRGFRCSFKL